MQGDEEHHNSSQITLTADLNQNILNLKPSVPPPLQNEPYQLTFFIGDDDKSFEGRKSKINSYEDDDDVVVESYNKADIDNRMLELDSAVQHESCIVSAFLYFITISTFAYLVILWIRQKMHMQMELMHWW